MADVKMRALVAIGRFLVSLGAGLMIWWMWSDKRPLDDQVYAVAAGIISMVFAYLLLNKLKGGGD